MPIHLKIIKSVIISTYSLLSFLKYKRQNVGDWGDHAVPKTFCLIRNTFVQWKKERNTCLNKGKSFLGNLFL